VIVAAPGQDAVRPPAHPRGMALRRLAAGANPITGGSFMRFFPRSRLLLLGGAGALAAAGLGGYALAAHSPSTATIQAVHAAATVPAPATPVQGAQPATPADPAGPDDRGPEQADPAGETANETPGSDGPGGHADEPSNAGADHQAEGAE
jgi:hypothetical protein